MGQLFARCKRLLHWLCTKLKLSDSEGSEGATAFGEVRDTTSNDSKKEKNKKGDVVIYCLFFKLNNLGESQS